MKKIIKWNNWEIPENAEHNDDEDPGSFPWLACFCFRPANRVVIDLIQGLEPTVMNDLGMPRRRDPDALPPNNIVERALNIIYHGAFSLGGGNMLFAVKAGLLTGWPYLYILVQSFHLVAQYYCVYHHS